jgi:hypothetical protein
MKRSAEGRVPVSCCGETLVFQRKEERKGKAFLLQAAVQGLWDPHPTLTGIP